MGKSRQKRKVSTYNATDDNASESLFIQDYKQLSEENATQKTTNLKYFLAGSISLITFLVYLTCLRNEFLNWDDNLYAYENPFIRSFNTALFKWAFLSFYASNWHPLTWISHALDYTIWGLNPVGHHLTNIILHAVNTALVVLISVRLIQLYKERTVTKETTPWLKWQGILITGGVTGLLFGLHPIHVESVAWVAERKDLLCALFFLFSVMTYIKYAEALSSNIESLFPFRNKQYLITFGFFVLALLSKPMAVTLPIVLLILDWCPFKRLGSLKSFLAIFIEKLPFIILSLCSSILTILAQKSGGSISMVHIPFFPRVLVACESLIAYLAKILLPLKLIPFYPYQNNAVYLSVEFLFATTLVIGITVTCIIIAKTKRLWLSVWSYYVVTLIPVLGIVQVGFQSMADRYMYLPSIGPFLIIGLTAAKVYEGMTDPKLGRELFKMASLFIGLAFLISMSYATVKQIGIWKDSTVFWNYIIEKNPLSYFAHNNLGGVFVSQGNLDRAIPEFQAALLLNPDYAEAHYNLGTAFLSQGNLDRAIPEFQAALLLSPDFARAHSNLAIAFASQGNLDRAIPEFQAALLLNPDYAEAHYNLGTAFLSQGNLDRAIPEFQAALLLNPDYHEARQSLNDIISRRH